MHTEVPSMNHWYSHILHFFLLITSANRINHITLYMR